MAAATAAISKLTMMGAWVGAGVSLGAGVCVMALLLLGRRPQGADGAHGVVPLLMLLPLLLLLPAAPALGFTRHAVLGVGLCLASVSCLLGGRTANVAPLLGLQASRGVERALAFVGLAAGVGAVISATAASASGILPTIYAPLLAALLLVCRVRPLVGASPMLDDVVSRVGETVARSALLKKWEAKLGSGGLVVAAWAALQMVAECVGWVVGGGSASTAFVVSALAADIAAATLAIVAACHFTIPSIDFDQQLEASVELQAALAEKTSLLARISQRIQSPSNEILQRMHDLLATKLVGEQKAYAVDVQNCALSLLDTSNDVAKLLHVSYRPGEFVMRQTAPFVIRDLVEEALRTAAPAVNMNKIDLSYSIEPNIPVKVIGEKESVREILLQLLSNAVAFTKRGEIRVKVSRADAADVAYTSDDQTTPSDEVTLTFVVSDTGKGMSPEKRRSICNLLFSPAAALPLDHKDLPRGSRTGLGLYVCHKLVRTSLRGDMRIESQPGNGTQVYFSGRFTALPGEEEEEAASTGDAAADAVKRVEFNRRREYEDEDDDLRGLRILAVDDSEGVRTFIEEELKALGCHILCTGDGTHAIRQLRFAAANKTPYNLLLLDYHLSAGDGLWVVSTVREQKDLASLRIAVMVSPAEASRFAHGRTRGVHYTLLKPLRLSDLLSVVRAAYYQESVDEMDMRRKMAATPAEAFGSDERALIQDMGVDLGLEVLVVAEDPETVARIRDLAKRNGHKASTLQDAIALLSQLPLKPYDALVMGTDAKTSRVVEVVRAIRSREIPSLYRMPIVVISARPSHHEKFACHAAGVDRYLGKGQGMEEEILALLNEIQSHRESPSSPAPLISHPPIPSVPIASARRGSLWGLPNPPPMMTSRLEQVQKILSVFVPQQFQELIAPSGVESVELGDAVCKSITIFFSDIRDFTSITEAMYVNEVMEFLNTYLAFAVPAIAEEGGFVDKFIGDAIMAIFAQGSPEEQANASVRAAVRMLHDLDYCNTSAGLVNAETGIGINTGKVIMGVVGTETRMEPTVLGDAVNLASRTEALCKKYGARILITEHTKEKMALGAEQFTIRLIDHVTVKGKSQSCRIYEVVDGDKDEVREQKERILRPYHEALLLFTDGKFAEARDKFEECLALRPDDKPCLIYVERCTELLADPPSTWDGIYHLVNK